MGRLWTYVLRYWRRYLLGSLCLAPPHLLLQPFVKFSCGALSEGRKLVTASVELLLKPFLLGCQALAFARRLLTRFLTQRAPRPYLPAGDASGRLTKPVTRESRLHRWGHRRSAVRREARGKCKESCP